MKRVAASVETKPKPSSGTSSTSTILRSKNKVFTREMRKLEGRRDSAAATTPTVPVLSADILVTETPPSTTAVDANVPAVAAPVLENIKDRRRKQAGRVAELQLAAEVNRQRNLADARKQKELYLRERKSRMNEAHFGAEMKTTTV